MKRRKVNDRRLRKAAREALEWLEAHRDTHCGPHDNWDKDGRPATDFAALVDCIIADLSGALGVAQEGDDRG